MKAQEGVPEFDEMPFTSTISSETAGSGALILRFFNVFLRERVPGSDSSGMVANLWRTCLRAGRRIGLL
jgi:hypothetical protein